MTHDRFKQAAQQVKALGLSRALDRFSAYRGAPVLARDLLSWTDWSWELLAHAAGVNMPSPETRSLVIAELAKREALVALSNAERVR